jgi:hypothetical protein
MKVSINSLHHQTSDWLRELEFYKVELGILRKRLEEVAAKNTATAIMAQVEHFQNRFILIQEQIDTLHHENGERFGRIDQLAKLRPTHSEEKFEAGKDKMNDQVNDISASFRATRYEFNNFLSKVM